MALKIGITGSFNSGKSYARRNVIADESVVLAPSYKMIHMQTKDKKAAPPLEIVTPKHKGFKAVGEALGMRGKMPYEILWAMLNEQKHIDKFYDGTYKLVGTHMVVLELAAMEPIAEAVSTFMPHVKNLFFPDFTHHISEVVSKRTFIDQKAGGQAYQRFWELAGDVARGLLLSPSRLRHDLIVIIEFHSEFDDNLQEFRIFVPAGKMVSEKFLPDSYFDFMFYTSPKKDEETGEVIDWRFVTRKIGPYNGRSGGLYPDQPYIPNDLAPVLEKIRKTQGI